MKKEMLIGFLTALLATFFGCYLFVEYFSNKGFFETIKLIKEGNLEGKVLVLGAIANIFVFFVFLKKKQIYRARGVLLATFFIAFLVLFLTVFSF
jgi:Ca2+/Na+ antiporter